MASILLVEPYDTGSHAAWLRGYQRHSHHQIDVLGLPGNFWQWRMRGGAVTAARLFTERMKSSPAPALIIASDMLDLTTFQALTRRYTSTIPCAVYFHENQLTYPPGPRQKRDLALGFINYASALSADAVFFNSAFHRDAFLAELPRLLKHFSDFNELQTIDAIRDKSSVLPVGLELKRFDEHRCEPKPAEPVILWNHRWEYDKNPVAFFSALYQLMSKGVPFKVIVTGENNRQKADEFEEARQRLGERILHFGYVASFADYARLLWQATHIVSCAWQDFFGISVCEAIYCGCQPILSRRLNYPALIPSQFHDQVLYDEGRLFSALDHALAQPMPAPAALREYVASFDWSIQAPRYDDTFEQMISG